MKNKKILLYVFFSLVMVASLTIFILDYNKKDKVEDPLIDEPTPSQIEVKEEEKISVVVEPQTSTTIKMAPDVNLAEERNKYNNNDIIGRLEIPDLFNVLVVKGTDNRFYLDHDLSKKYDMRGSEFIDYRVNPTSKQVNIYGHNTRDPRKFNVAFLKLEQFLDKDFFDKNQYIIFQYDGGKSIYKIKAMREIYESNVDHLYVDYTGSEFVSHVNKLTGDDGLIHRRNIEVNENSEILVLQTCSHHWDKALYIITAVKIS